MPVLDNDLRVRQALARAGIAARGGPAGGIVVGPPNSGKSTVLSALREGTDDAVISVSGVGRTAGLVFGHLDGCRAAGDTQGEPSVARLRWALADEIRGRSVAAMFVDDAHLLDDDAAAVVHSLVVHDGVPAFVACTTEEGGAVPVAIRSLWKDGHLPRFDLPPIGESEVREYVTHMVGHPITVRDVAAFTRWSRGDPGLLIDLVASSLDAGQWTVRSGVAVLADRPAPSQRLREDLEATAGALSGEVLAVVEAFGAATPVIGSRMLDWLPLAPMVELVGMDTLLEAERRGLIAADGDQVRLTVPFLADVVAAQTPSLRRARLAADLASAVQAVADRAPSSVPRDQVSALTGLLALGSPAGSGSGDRLRAARAALRLGDPAAVWDLAAADGAQPQEQDPELALLYTWSLIHLNDIAGLERMIRAWSGHPSPEWQGLVGFFTEFKERYRSGTRAFLKRHETSSGGLLGAVAEQMDRDRMSGGWFGFLLAEAAMLAGRCGDARALLDASGSAARDDGLLIFHLVLVEARLETTVNGAERARAIVEAARRATAWHSDQVCAAADFTYALAQVNLGGFDDALARLRDCAPFLAATRLADLPVRMAARVAVMSTGAPTPFDDAAIEPPADPYGALVAGEVTVDRAWSQAAGGDPRAAIERLRRFGEKAIGDTPMLAVDQFELALRFCGPGGADARRIAALVRAAAAAMDPARRVRALIAYAEALADAGAPALDAVADSYRELGLLPVAADVHAQAAQAYRASGDIPDAVASASAAAALVRTIGGLVSPAQNAVVLPALTRREREIVKLAAEELTNARIAARLQLSVRTVEGHLLRASAKYGVRDRRSLVALWQELA